LAFRALADASRLTYSFIFLAACISAADTANNRTNSRARASIAGSRIVPDNSANNRAGRRDCLLSCRRSSQSRPCL